MGLLLGGLALSNLVEQFDRYLFTVSPIPFIDYSTIEYSILCGPAFSIVYFVGNFVCSISNDYVRADRVTVVALSCAISSMALLCIPFTGSFWELALLRVLMGLAQAPITSFCSSLIKDEYIEQDRGFAFGIFDSATFLGFAISLAIGTLVYDNEGWKIPYFIFGLAGIAYSFVLRMFLRDPAFPNSYLSKIPPLSYWSKNVHDDEDRSDDVNFPLILDSDDKSISDNEQQKAAFSLRDLYERLKPVFSYMREYPSILLMCIPTGLRFMGGYQFAYYAALFFSDKFKTDEDGGHPVSCSFSYPEDGGPLNGEDFCDTNSPYCINGECKSLSDTPWHNKGMDHTKFEIAFAVATVCGSVVGCLFGGVLGDYMSSKTSFGLSGRLLVGGIGLLFAAPMYVLVFTLDFPYCFICLALGGLGGEIYYGQTLAVLAEMVPQKLFTMTCSFYLSFLICCGSNGTILVPLVRQSFEKHFSYTYTFVSSGSTGEQTNVVPTHGSDGFMWTLCCLVGGSYAIAGVLFLCCVPPMQRDIERMKSRSTIIEPIIPNQFSVSNLPE
jgi:MFS family permease